MHPLSGPAVLKVSIISKFDTILWHVMQQKVIRGRAKNGGTVQGVNVKGTDHLSNS